MSRLISATFLLLLGSVALSSPLVEQLDNTAEPTRGERSVQLEEQWRLGEDEEFLLGSIQDALIDKAGFVYLLDEQLAQIQVIAPGGSLDRTP